MIKKKILLIVGAVLLAVGIGVFAYFIYMRGVAKGDVVSPVVKEKKEEVKKEEVKEEEKKWTDPLGFTFSYPKSIKLNPHDEDLENYADLELTNEKYSGGVFIWAKDFYSSSLEEWITAQKDLKEASAIDTEISGIPAKKMILPGIGANLKTVFIYDELLYIIETKENSLKYWEAVYKDVLDNITFVKIDGQDSSGSSVGDSGQGGVGGGDVVLEEEVVE